MKLNYHIVMDSATGNQTCSTNLPNVNWWVTRSDEQFLEAKTFGVKVGSQ